MKSLLEERYALVSFYLTSAEGSCLLFWQFCTKSSYDGDTFDVALEVVQAAEENYPQESIEIYQKYVEMRIAWRGRENYRIASQYLISIRKLFQKIGRSDSWTTYITELRGQHHNLPALKDEMAKAMV